MLVAPAGYGKTTLARQWLEGKSAAWYTGTPASTDVAALAARLRDRIATVVPGVGGALMERLPVTTRSDEDATVLASMLAGGSHRHGLLTRGSCLTTITRLRDPNPPNSSSRRLCSRRRSTFGDHASPPRLGIFAPDPLWRGLRIGPRRARDDQRRSERFARPAGDRTRQGSWNLLKAGLRSWVWPRWRPFHRPTSARRPTSTDSSLTRSTSVLPVETRRTLCELALYDIEGRRLALDLLRSDEAERVTQAGLDSGFLTEMGEGRFDMHPLLRAFLQQKLKEENPKALSQIVPRAVDNLIRHELWDEAFELTQRLDTREPLVSLIAASMDRLLATGRTATLRTWLARAPRDAPAVRLAEAELAFRDGRFYESETLAALAGRDRRGYHQTSRHVLFWLRAGRLTRPRERRRRVPTTARAAELLFRLSFVAWLSSASSQPPLSLNVRKPLS